MHVVVMCMRSIGGKITNIGFYGEKWTGLNPFSKRSVRYRLVNGLKQQTNGKSK